MPVARAMATGRYAKILATMNLWEPRLWELRRLAEVYKHSCDCRERYADRLMTECEVAHAS